MYSMNAKIFFLFNQIVSCYQKSKFYISPKNNSTFFVQKVFVNIFSYRKRMAESKKVDKFNNIVNLLLVN